MSANEAASDACPYCGHALAHHDQPDCWECTNAGTRCDSEDAHAAVPPACPTWTCPECDSPGYLCAKSDHGTVDGPALHCTRFPRHNEFDVAEFARWERGGRVFLSSEAFLASLDDDDRPEQADDSNQAGESRD